MKVLNMTGGGGPLLCLTEVKGDSEVFRAYSNGKRAIVE